MNIGNVICVSFMTIFQQAIKEQFHVPMGAFDGAEVCELIGPYIISIISESINFKSIGPYRDDGLAVLKSATGSE